VTDDVVGSAVATFISQTWACGAMGAVAAEVAQLYRENVLQKTPILIAPAGASAGPPDADPAHPGTAETVLTRASSATLIARQKHPPGSRTGATAPVREPGTSPAAPP